MAQKCSGCSRLNPADAIFCYFDGRPLDAHAYDSGPIHFGRQPFPSSFVLMPSGRVCRNFDELARACQDDWAGAIQALQQGLLANFLQTIGRPDLAQKAQEAIRFPDLDRGLDQFLGKLPSKVLRPPRLAVEMSEIPLDALQPGQDYGTELRLRNLGDRLLHGWLSTDSPWLLLGEPPGAQAKMIQFHRELVVPVQVVGRRLRASTKPLQARIGIDLNGDGAVLEVQALVPVRPFPEGCLAGAQSPRQLAQKAKANPKEAAILLENGAVARWYETNGWVYPIRGASASGLAAIQQYFEFLGLVAIPPVEISEGEVALSAPPGAALEHILTVRTAQNKPVWAYGISDQPWLEVGRTVCAGRSALLPLKVAAVPGRTGETLTARLLVVANGNRKFRVLVTLRVAHAPLATPV